MTREKRAGKEKERKNVIKERQKRIEKERTKGKEGGRQGKYERLEKYEE